MSESLVTISNANLGYGKNVLLKGIQLSVCKGDFLGIVGPNGAGKTTLLRALLGSLKPLSGEVQSTRRPDGSALQFGYVPQREGIDLIYPLSIFDLVMMARTPRLKLLHRPSQHDRDAVLRALEVVGIEALAEMQYAKLSGGQKQRALIARALAVEPDILVLDEPTNGMDLAGETAILDLIQKLHQDRGLTVVLVSHLLNTVANYAQKIVFIRDGWLEEGPVADVLTSQNLTSVYGLSVQVKEIEGQRVILRGSESEKIAVISQEALACGRNHSKGGVQ